MSNNDKRRNRRRQGGKPPRSQKPAQRVKLADAALREIGGQVKRRIPGDYGFALLVFPVGEHGDGAAIRYAGDCDRRDVLGMMAGWLALQRGQLPPVAADASTFSTTPPVAPGYYVLKSTHDQTPELIHLEEADGDLRIHHWNGDGFEPSDDWVNQLDPVHHIWLGPIPEPWKAWDGSQRDVLIDSTSIDGHAAALHHADAFSPILAAYVQEFRGKSNTPDEPLPPMILGILQDAVGHGYAQGIVQQMNNPFRVPAP